MAIPVWKRILKWFTWFFGCALALLVVAYLALLVINWRDEPPSESARRLEAIYRDRSVISDADNGYVYVMGFAVAPNADPREAGVRRIEWIRKSSGQRHFEIRDDPAPGDTSYRLTRPPAAQGVSDACKVASRECITTLEEGAEALREWTQSEQWLLDRYVGLLHHKGWVELVAFGVSAPLPAYAEVLEGQKLLVAKAYVLANQKDAAGVSELRGADVRFWRRVLASSDILITKMIAVAALHRHFALGNLILRRLPAELELQGMPQEWATPLTDEERSMLRTFTGEWMFGNALIRDSVESASWRAVVDNEIEAGFADKLVGRALVPFFQQQDTNNRRADMFIRATDAMNVPFEQFPEASSRAQLIFDHPGGGRSPFTRLYNPVGDLLLSMSVSGFGPYGARVMDVEGSRRAAVLAVNLRSRRVDAHQVPMELAASTIRSPYSGEPLLWDTAEQTIVFVGLERSDRGRHAFKY